MHATKSVGWLYLLICLLAACDSDIEQKSAESQRFYFVESLNLVESAGLQLQVRSPSAEAVSKALERMDEGLKMAFEVKAEFLDQYDPRLSKNYQRYFVKGIESYRLGIEAGDAEEQKSGLRLLAQWADFWSQAGKPILVDMQAK